MPDAVPAPVPHSLFRAEAAAGSDRFEQWQASIATIYEAAPLPGTGLDGFQATVSAHHLGHVLLGQTDVGAYRYGRSKAYAARDGMDHYMVQFYLSGGFVGHCDGQEIAARAGDIALYHLARPLQTWSQHSRTLALVITREAMEAALPQAPSLHGKLLRRGHAFGDLLGDHLLSLNARLPAVSLQDAPTVAHATVQMIAACMHPDRTTRAEARAQTLGVALVRIQRHIATHLAQPLVPADLCAAFGISRRLLYELFEPHGGVQRYIQRQRLQRAFGLLANPAHQRLRVAQIAMRCGFVSEAHFSRAFRAAFGLAPSDVRHLPDHCGHLRPQPDGDGSAAVDYAAWVRRL